MFLVDIQLVLAVYSKLYQEMSLVTLLFCRLTFQKPKGMIFILSLTRRSGESINLYTSDGFIKIILEPHYGGQVRVHIEAPQSVVILRSEIDPEDSAFKNRP